MRSQSIEADVVVKRMVAGGQSTKVGVSSVCGVAESLTLSVDVIS